MAKPHFVCVLMTNSPHMAPGAWSDYINEVLLAAALISDGIVPFHERSFSHQGDENCCIIADIHETEIESFREQLAAIREKLGGSQLSLFYNEPTYV